MKKFLLAFCTIAFLVSCDQTASDQTIHPGTNGMAVSITEATIPPMGNTSNKIVFTVSSEVPWKLDKDGADWLIFDINGKTSTSLKGDSGTTTIEMYADVNTDTAEYRKATIKFHFSDTNSTVASVDVYQERPYLKIKKYDGITIDEPYSVCDFLFRWDESEQLVSDTEQAITIYSNTEWELVVRDSAKTHLCESGLEPFDGMASLMAIGQGGYLVGPSSNQWLVCSQIKGDKTGDLRNGDNGVNVYFNPQRYNITRNDRSINLAVLGKNNEWQTQYLSFLQENLIFVGTLDGIDIADKDNSGNIPTVITYPACNCADIPQHQFIIESELDWLLDDCSSTWVVATPKEGVGSGVDGTGLTTSGTINLIEADANPTAEPRTEILTFISQADVTPKPSLYVKVKQEGYVFEPSSANVAIPNNDLTEKNVNFRSSGHWEVDASSIPQWITIKNGSGIGTEFGASDIEFFTINANSQNLQLTDRYHEIIVKSTQPGNSMTQKISVTQNKYIFTARSTDPDLQFGTDESVDAPATLEINSSGDWDISIVYPDSYTEDQYWLECESYSGSGNANVRYWAKTVNGDVNIDRLATIVVSSTTHKNAGEPIDDYEIPVTQRKFSFNITGDTTMSYYAVDSSSKKISIDCSVAWQATASENWVKLSHTTGTSNDKTLSITIENNLLLAPRSATVTISNIDPAYGHHSKSFKIEQSGFIFKVSGTTSYSGLAPVRANGAYQVDVICSGSWSVTSQGSWITPSLTNVDGGTPETTKTVKFTVLDNPNLSPRSAEVIISSNLNPQLSQSVSFSQNAFEFDNTSRSFSFDAINSKSETIEVKCSGDWALEDYESWMGADKTSGSGNAIITIKPENNTNKGSGRMNKTFKVVSSLHKSLSWSNMDSVSKRITIYQSGLQFDDVPVTVPAFAAISPIYQTVTIGICDGGWEIKSYPSWLTVSPTSGAGIQSILITPYDNIDMKINDGTIEVVSKLNSSIKKIITVSQDAFVFDMKAVTISFEATDNAANVQKVSVDSSSAGWTLSQSDTWFTVSPTSSFDGAKTELTIIPTENKNTTPREATITITSSKNAKYTKVITVTQKGVTSPTAN